MGTRPTYYLALASYHSYSIDRLSRAAETRAVTLPTISAPDNLSPQSTWFYPPSFPFSVPCSQLPNTAQQQRNKKTKKRRPAIRTLQQGNSNDVQYDPCVYAWTLGWFSAMALCVMSIYPRPHTLDAFLVFLILQIISCNSH